MPSLSKCALSVYLIKDRYKTGQDALKNIEELVAVEFPDINGSFFYKKSQSYQPDWITKFFQDSLREVRDLYSATANGLILSSVRVGNQDRLFAVAFGYGRHFLDPDSVEERFGLKVTLNVVDPDSIRKIDKKNLSSIPKDVTEQLTKVGSASDFGIDIEQDLVRSVTGISNDERFGHVVTGKDALSVSAPVHLSNLGRFLKLCYERYESEDYKKEFGWIDHVAEIKDHKLIATLDSLLVKNILDTHKGTWMSVPEILEWSQIKGFSYSNNANDIVDDINLQDFLNAQSPGNKTIKNLDLLFKSKVQCFDTSDRLKAEWSAYECVYSEIVHDGHTYLLNNKKWYQIDKEFAEDVNSEFKTAITESSFTLPPYNHKNEGDYNLNVPSLMKDCYCMDKKLIVHGGTHHSVEFCDLITANRNIIHVKRYGASSVLSHLFNQGLVSGELFLSDRKFRKKLNGILPGKLQLADTDMKPAPSDYKIVYAIISDEKKDLDIPFFSKLGFRNAKRKLETFGFPVEITKIPAK